MLSEADSWSCDHQQPRTFQQTGTDTGHIGTECLHGIDAGQTMETVTSPSREDVNVSQSAAQFRNAKPTALCTCYKEVSICPSACNEFADRITDQYNETNVMYFLFNLLRIKRLYMFRALLVHPQEVLHKRHLIYCVRMSVGYGNVRVTLHCGAFA
jgi:hypothetical protein